METKATYPGIQVLSVPADVTDEKSVGTLFDTVKRRFGSADVLVNNAGALTPGLIKDVDINAFWKDFVRPMMRLFCFGEDIC
jgi:NAD(P)-dependent dehydrogenase (short-subunit alcohol dehydrogenase family)